MPASSKLIISVHPIRNTYLVSAPSGGSWGGVSYQDRDVIELGFGPGDAPVTGASMFFDATAVLDNNAGDLNGFDAR